MFFFLIKFECVFSNDEILKLYVLYVVMLFVLFLKSLLHD